MKTILFVFVLLVAFSQPLFSEQKSLDQNDLKKCQTMLERKNILIEKLKNICLDFKETKLNFDNLTISYKKLEGNLIKSEEEKDKLKKEKECLQKKIETLTIKVNELDYIKEDLNKKLKVSEEARKNLEKNLKLKKDSTVDEKYKTLTDRYLILKGYTNQLEKIFIEPNLKESLNYEKAEVLFTQRKYKEAIAVYDEMLKNNPKDEIVLVNKGLCFVQLEDYDKAIKLYLEIISLNEKNMPAHYNLGIAYYFKGMIKESADEYEKVTQIDPENITAYYNLALTYEKLDKKLAIKNWNRYIELAKNIKDQGEHIKNAKEHIHSLES